MLYIFYEQVEKDRWFKYDRYPRRIISRLIRGKTHSGYKMVAEELMRGLDLLNIPYRLNDYKYIQNHPEQLACIITTYVLEKYSWQNPILLGASIFPHPIDFPDLLQKYPTIQKIVIPCGWMKNMFAPYFGGKVEIWPVGINTTKWDVLKKSDEFDFLIYDKIRWDHKKMEVELVHPLTDVLNRNKLTYQFIRYGQYNHKQLKQKLRNSRAVIFLCEHESQGLAYQQILSTDTPILAWDRGGYWQDPNYFPEKVQFQPVSSVPYWSDECGEKFASVEEFPAKLELFLQRASAGSYAPRKYILDNLTLEKASSAYNNIATSIFR
jgi:hypothetical protein